MAALHAPSPSLLASFLPIARAQLFPQLQQPVRRIPLLQNLRFSASLLPAAFLPIPALLSDLWDGLLNAVPKKKTSHMKSRHRQMASGKHLRDVTALNKCSACGRTKRAHVLCPYCVMSIRRWISTGFKTAKQLEAEDTAKLIRINEERRLRGAKPLDLPKAKDEDTSEGIDRSKQYLQTHTLPDTSNANADIFSLATTPAHFLVASGHSSIRIYSTKGQTIHTDTAEDEHPFPLIQTLEKAHPLGAHHICASLDGQVAASVGFGGEVRIWELSQTPDSDSSTWVKRSDILPPKTKKERDAQGTAGAGESWALALSENGQYLAASTHDGRVNVYDTTTSPTPERITQYETKGSFALSVDLSPDGNMTASGHQNGSVYIFSNTTRRLTHSLPGLLKAVRTLKFSPANRYLAAAGDARTIALYDTKSGEQIANLSGHASWVMSLDWNWSGEFLVSGGYDGKVKIWSVERRECVATQTESEKCLWAVKWLVKGAGARNESFVTAGVGGTLAFYREASGT